MPNARDSIQKIFGVGNQRSVEFEKIFQLEFRQKRLTKSVFNFFLQTLHVCVTFAKSHSAIRNCRSCYISLEWILAAIKDSLASRYLSISSRRARSNSPQLSLIKSLFGECWRRKEKLIFREFLFSWKRKGRLELLVHMECCVKVITENSIVIARRLMLSFRWLKSVKGHVECFGILTDDKTDPLKAMGSITPYK